MQSEIELPSNKQQATEKEQQPRAYACCKEHLSMKFNKKRRRNEYTLQANGSLTSLTRRTNDVCTCAIYLSLVWMQKSEISFKMKLYIAPAP